MKVIVDNKIPYIREAIECLADEVVYASGAAFTADMVRDADALIIRTRTRCDRKLLEGSRVRFIATATIGYDHIDTGYCHRAGIAWTNAPGCNSASVAQYIHSTLLLLEQRMARPLADLTLGIVGVGNVGSKVKRVAERLGMRVLLNDPPREAEQKRTAAETLGGENGNDAFVTLQQLAAEADILTFHVPLCREGSYKTFHLGNDAFFGSLQRKPVLINTSRGEVIETAALLRALDKGHLSDAVIDVWENEPDIHLPLLDKVLLGTPHIAGYSADGKANATRMSLDALCRFFHLTPNYNIQPPAPEEPHIIAPTLTDAYLQMYDPRRDSNALKAHPDQFEKLRGDYPLRREEDAYTVEVG